MRTEPAKACGSPVMTQLTPVSNSESNGASDRAS